MQRKEKNTSTSTYNVRILRASYADIERAIEKRQLQPVRGYRSGSGSGRLWQPVGQAAAGQTAQEDRTFRLGRTTLRATLYRLPEEEFTALVTGSRGQFKRDPEISQLLTLLEAKEYQAGEGSTEPTLVDVLSSLTLPTCIWRPNETRLIEQGSDWLLSLGFETGGHRRGLGKRVGVGVDVGLNPLATTAVGDHILVTEGPDEDQTRHMGSFSSEVAEVVEYLLARRELDLLTEELVRCAAYVAVEALTLNNLREKASFRRFVSRAREAAVLDWHQAWLPQRLRNAGIPFIRVDPAYTSQQCQCGSYATVRQTNRLRCRACGWVGDANENAALNIRRLGQRLLRLRRAS